MQIPDYARPTKITSYTFLAIFILVLILGFFKFPISSFMSGNLNNSFNIGIPFPFLELKFSGEMSNPLRILNLIIDLLIYFVLAYLIDIGFNAIKNSKIFKKENIKK